MMHLNSVNPAIDENMRVWDETSMFRYNAEIASYLKKKSNKYTYIKYIVYIIYKICIYIIYIWLYVLELNKFMMTLE